MMELLWIIIIGAIVGALAKLLMPGSDPGGFFVTALVGMGGALIATGPRLKLGPSPADPGDPLLSQVVVPRRVPTTRRRRC